MWSIVPAAEQSQLRLAVELLGLGGEALRCAPLPPCPFAVEGESGPRFHALLICRRNRPVAALGFHRLSRGRGSVYLPLEFSGEELSPDARRTLARAAAGLLDRYPRCLWQVLPAAEQEPPWRPWLEELGFQVLSTVQYWRCVPPGSCPAVAAAPGGTVEPAGVLAPEELLQLVQRSYRHSRDFPELARYDSPAQALASYYYTGGSGDRYWYVGRTRQGTPAGVALLAEVSAEPQRRWELCYVGVEPRHRGQGWAKALLRYALRQAHRLGVQQVLLGVDCRNEPALRLYRRLGFELFQQRRALCRLPRAE